MKDETMKLLLRERTYAHSIIEKCDFILAQSAVIQEQAKRIAELSKPRPEEIEKPPDGGGDKPPQT